ncbi:movement protein [Sesamum angolense]|uniref:Movement protein n=1 Tax=Sesamum angolense TaxID=2727404 RepID=A0AAE1VT92_9LAMI|nr:movement protein [Sesamum angolense]
MKIGWDNTTADTKASILVGDSKSAIADRLGRLIKIHFIGDGYFEGSRTEKAREYAQALFGLGLRSICANIQIWTKSGLTRASSQGSRRTDKDLQEEPLRGEFSDGPIPEPMKVSKTATAGHAEQENNYNDGDRLQTSKSLSGFFSRMTVSNKTMERIMRQDSNLSPYDGFRIREIGEFAIPMEFTGNVMEMQLIPKEEILEELSRLREEIAVTMKWIHIGTIEVVIKATFREGIDSEIHLSIMDRRINNLRDGYLGTMIGNLYPGKLMFDIHPRIAYNLADQDFSRVLTLHQDFKRKDLMKEGIRPYSITYRITYVISNTHHSDLFLRKEYIEIPKIFKEFAKQPVVGRYEGMLEITGHEILVAGVAGQENGSMTLGLSFVEDHKHGKEKDREFAQQNPGVFPKEAREIIPVIVGRDFSQKILILNMGIREAKIMIGGAFGTLWFRATGFIVSDSFYKESEEEIKKLKEALQELKTMDISEESNFLSKMSRG